MRDTLSDQLWCYEREVYPQSAGCEALQASIVEIGRLRLVLEHIANEDVPQVTSLSGACDWMHLAWDMRAFARSALDQ